MAVLAYEILQQDIDRWSSLAAIEATLDVNGIKQLFIVLDPLIDPTIVNPSGAYESS
jgi:hypothetical protein